MKIQFDELIRMEEDNGLAVSQLYRKVLQSVRDFGVPQAILRRDHLAIKCVEVMKVYEESPELITPIRVMLYQYASAMYDRLLIRAIKEIQFPQDKDE